MSLRKALLFFLIAWVLPVVSCRKSTPDSGMSAMWTIRDIEYKAGTVSKQSASYTAANGLNTMTVFFSTLPSVSSNYKIADEAKVSAGTLASGEIAIAFNVAGTDDYVSTGTAADSATISISGGTLTIKVLPTPLVHFAGGFLIDSTTGSGVIKTNQY